MKAREGDASFWTGNKTLDTSQGVGAHTAEAQKIVAKGSVIGKYRGKFEGVKVYETKQLGNGKFAGGITLPPDRITVGTNVFPNESGIFEFSETQDLLRHEFGHILESRESFVGLKGFYKIIALESLATSNLPIANNYWTETWANHLSTNYFGYGGFYDQIKYPALPLSDFNRAKFLFK